MKPLIYLELRQLINAIKNTLRSPKRLIPALIMAAWIIAWFIRGLLAASGAPAPGTPGFGQWGDALQRLPSNMEAVQAAIFLFLSLGMVVVIYQSFTSGILIFGIAHIDFLFPTPISRRRVILVKLIRDYLRYGFWVTFFYLFLGSAVFATLNVRMLPEGLAGIAALIALVLLVVNIAHTVNIVFTFGYERLRQLGTAIKIAMWAALASVVVAAIYQYMKTGDTYLSIMWAAKSPVVNAVFAPAQWCSYLIIAPILGGATSEEYTHLAMLWLLATASFLILMSRNENIYEPSLGVSVKYANRRQAIRSGDMSQLKVDEMREKGLKRAGGLSLPPFGTGAVALFWKNLVTKFRVSKSQFALSMLVPVVVVLLLKRVHGAGIIYNNLPFVLPYMAWLFSMTSQPMRAELKHANILKSMPISPHKVVLSHAMSVVVQIMTAVAVFAISMWLFLPGIQLQILFSCAFAAPFIGFTGISVVAIASMLYPDSRDAAQNYICGLVGFLLAFLALLPSLILAALMAATHQADLYRITAAVCLLNVLIGGAGVALSGMVFRRFDPTES